MRNPSRKPRTPKNPNPIPIASAIAAALNNRFATNSISLSYLNLQGWWIILLSTASTILSAPDWELVIKSPHFHQFISQKWRSWFHSLSPIHRKSNKQRKERSEEEKRLSHRSFVRRSIGIHRQTKVKIEESIPISQSKGPVKEKLIEHGDQANERGISSNSKRKRVVDRGASPLAQQNGSVAKVYEGSWTRGCRALSTQQVSRPSIWEIEINQFETGEKAMTVELEGKLMRGGTPFLKTHKKDEGKGEGALIIHDGAVERKVACHCKSFSSFEAYLNSLCGIISTRINLSSYYPFCVSKYEYNCVYVCIPGYCLVGYRNLFFILFMISVKHTEEVSDKLAYAFEVHASKDKSSSSTVSQFGQKSQCIPHTEDTILNENLGSSKAASIEEEENQIRVESLDAQLEKIKIECSKTNNSVMGYVLGDHIEFKTMKFKPLSTWRLIKGELQIYDMGHGRFEYVFRKGQLFLLKPSRPDINTKIEDTNVLDLWIRIFNLPPLLACNDGVRLILEENGVGKFIKFDRASGAIFARACVNIDIIKSPSWSGAYLNSSGEFNHTHIYTAPPSFICYAKFRISRFYEFDPGDCLVGFRNLFLDFILISGKQMEIFEQVTCSSEVWFIPPRTNHLLLLHKKMGP